MGLALLIARLLLTAVFVQQGRLLLRPVPLIAPTNGKAAVAVAPDQSVGP